MYGPTHSAFSVWHSMNRPVPRSKRRVTTSPTPPREMLRTVAGHMRSLLDRLATDWQAACMSQPCRSQTRHSAPLLDGGGSWSFEASGGADRFVFGAEEFMVNET